MARKKQALFYRKEIGRDESGEWITVICRMDRGYCDFVYAEASTFPGGPPQGVADSSDYQYLLGASAKGLEQMGFEAML